MNFYIWNDISIFFLRIYFQILFIPTLSPQDTIYHRRGGSRLEKNFSRKKNLAWATKPRQIEAKLTVGLKLSQKG